MKLQVNRSCILRTNETTYPEWTMSNSITIQNEDQAANIEYKYIKKKNGKVSLKVKLANQNLLQVIWEDGNNRRIDLLNNFRQKDRLVLVSDNKFNNTSDKHIIFIKERAPKEEMIPR